MDVYSAAKQRLGPARHRGKLHNIFEENRVAASRMMGGLRAPLAVRLLALRRFPVSQTPLTQNQLGR